ncbi:uncharacterized protein LOC124813381 [Hydra vulgaris]|uniref:uncharacterized protein LOC124813381 n=1 Tax=Hydra vulgaris TaxID=6087 RepID=UPI001F5F14ED|nr:uncharacterized protein LOC124813381 [Hydra vulgaris]
MLSCSLCQFKTTSLQYYAQHYSVHSCAYKIPCGIIGCKKSFSTFRAFTSHIHCIHVVGNITKSINNFVNIEKIGICSVLTCQVELPFNELIVHLKLHIKKRVSIKCPYEECTCRYKVISSFTAHLSRCHQIHKTTFEQSQINISSSETNLDHLNIDKNIDANEFNINDMIHNIGLFLLKLQCQYHIPSTTIQFIVTEMLNLNTINQYQTERILIEKLSYYIPEKDVHNIIQAVKMKDPFVIGFSKDRGLLRSTYIRKEYYKKNMNFVGPMEISLGRNEHGFECYTYYVPIKETLKRICQNTNFASLISQQANINPSSCSYSDYFDGEAFLNNPFFQKHPNSLHLILYQDSFELVNPLGSGRNKHQISATYMVVANLPPHLRTILNNIYLVQLCRDKNLKSFSQVTVFKELIRDLKSLEVDGILVGIKLYKAGVVAILGDNLGSHFLGGYSLGFNSKKGHICRFCLLKGNELQTLPYTAVIRSVEHHKSCIITLKAKPEDRFVFGVTRDSIFNELDSYHVCAPGLPACIAHDLFEGVIQYDLALSIKKLVKDGCFTYLHINGAIRRFSFRGDDRADCPALLTSKCDKLKGHAVQNWVFLRFLPLLLMDRIFDFNHAVWQLILLLREITELICASKVSLSQILFLQHLINEYLEQRKKLFPDIPLRPKHHYMYHYPFLIMKCGPQITLWTLRMESKHIFFKRSDRSAQNFINITKHLAGAH